jgi:16S rRNA G966 N2-methylase RsmD
LQANLTKLAPLLGGQWSVRSQKVMVFLNQTPPHCFDLIFLDPPYQDLVLPSLLDLFIQKEWVHSQSLVIMEHSKRSDFSAPQGWELQFRRKYGDTLVSICGLVEGHP